jgi:hypothetical protein
MPLGVSVLHFLIIVILLLVVVLFNLQYEQCHYTITALF